MNVLLAVTGSVATIKLPKLADLVSEKHEIKCITTDCGAVFLRTLADENHSSKKLYTEDSPYGNYLRVFDQGSLFKSVKLFTVYNEVDEWRWDKVGDRVLHIELKDWANALVIAPLSANTLSKMVNGIVDNLLTSVYRGWNVKKPLIIAPAMNTDMWEHPVTAEHINTLRRRHDKLTLVHPIRKKLACGVTGMGAMAHVTEIAKAIEEVRL